MNDLPTESDIAGMDIHTAKLIRKKLSKRISKIRVTDTVRLETKISAEKNTALQITIDWLFGRKLIPSKTKYAFLKFAVENLIKQVLQERAQEEKMELQKISQINQEEPMITQNEQNVNNGAGTNR